MTDNAIRFRPIVYLWVFSLWCAASTIVVANSPAPLADSYHVALSGSGGPGCRQSHPAKLLLPSPPSSMPKQVEWTVPEQMQVLGGDRSAAKSSRTFCQISWQMSYPANKTFRVEGMKVGLRVTSASGQKISLKLSHRLNHAKTDQVMVLELEEPTAQAKMVEVDQNFAEGGGFVPCGENSLMATKLAMALNRKIKGQVQVVSPLLLKLVWKDC